MSSQDEFEIRSLSDADGETETSDDLDSAEGPDTLEDRKERLLGNFFDGEDIFFANSGRVEPDRIEIIDKANRLLAAGQENAGQLDNHSVARELYGDFLLALIQGSDSITTSVRTRVAGAVLLEEDTGVLSSPERAAVSTILEVYNQIYTEAEVEKRPRVPAENLKPHKNKLEKALKSADGKLVITMIGKASGEQFHLPILEAIYLLLSINKIEAQEARKLFYTALEKFLPQDPEAVLDFLKQIPPLLQQDLCDRQEAKILFQEILKAEIQARQPALLQLKNRSRALAVFDPSIQTASYSKNPSSINKGKQQKQSAIKRELLAGALGLVIGTGITQVIYNSENLVNGLSAISDMVASVFQNPKKSSPFDSLLSPIDTPRPAKKTVIGPAGIILEEEPESLLPPKKP